MDVVFTTTGRKKVSNEIRRVLQGSAVIFGFALFYFLINWMNKYNFSGNEKIVAIMLAFSGLIMALIDGWFLLGSEV